MPPKCTLDGPSTLSMFPCTLKHTEVQSENTFYRFSLILKETLLRVHPSLGELVYTIPSWCTPPSTLLRVWVCMSEPPSWWHTKYPLTCLLHCIRCSCSITWDLLSIKSLFLASNHFLIVDGSEPLCEAKGIMRVGFYQVTFSITHSQFFFTFTPE